MTIRRFISLAFKILIATLSLAYLIYKMVVFDQWSEALDNLSSGFGTEQLVLIALILLLLPMNFGIETYKWHRLILTIEKIPFSKSLTGVLTGLSSAVFTPNRIGDIFTRPMILKPSNRIPGIALSMVNSLSATLATLLLGMISFVIYLPLTHQSTSERYLKWPVVLILFSVTFLLFLILFAKLAPILRWLGKFKWFRWLNDSADSISVLSLHLKIQVLLFACLRYVIYTTQFYLFLILFKIDLPAITILSMIGTLYLLLSLNPVPAFGDIGVRGSIAIFLLTPFTQNLAPMVFAIMGIWILNIMVPALVGLILLRKIKI